MKHTYTGTYYSIVACRFAITGLRARALESLTHRIGSGAAIRISLEVLISLTRTDISLMEMRQIWKMDREQPQTSGVLHCEHQPTSDIEAFTACASPTPARFPPSPRNTSSFQCNRVARPISDFNRVVVFL